MAEFTPDYFSVQRAFADAQCIHHVAAIAVVALQQLGNVCCFPSATHNWQIQFESGEAVAPDVGCARKFEVKMEGEKVLVELG